MSVGWKHSSQQRSIFDKFKHLLSLNYLWLFGLWAFLVAQMVKKLPAVWKTWGSIPELGRSPGEGNGNLFQYSCLGNPMNRGAWWATVDGITERRTQLSDWTHTHFLLLPARGFIVFMFPPSSVCGRLHFLFWNRAKFGFVFPAASPFLHLE